MQIILTFKDNRIILNILFLELTFLELMTLGTDPLKADSDDNGTTDGQEDADSDTLNNLREYQLGTDPNKAENHFTSRYGKSHLLRTQKARLVFRRNETESLDCAGTLK